MARRSSARLRNRASGTPKRVSLSHDVLATPKTLPARLTALQESDEMPGAFPNSVSPSSDQPVQTPSKAAPLKPAHEEMHPQRHQQTTAKPLEEARHLGFFSLVPQSEPPKHKSKLATLQATPTKSRDPTTDLKSSGFQFTFHREHSLELSPEAKSLMTEKREEAMKIREQMICDGEGTETVDELLQRKFAVPKSMKGRFGQAHVDHFAKMDSIAGHASAFRADSARQKTLLTPSKVKVPQNVQATGMVAAKSLKRSPSKAGLDDAARTPTRPNSQATVKPVNTPSSSHLPQSMIARALDQASDVQSPSPAKRVRRQEPETVGSAKLALSNNDRHAPATPQHKSSNNHSGSNNLAHLSSPTKSSLARAISVQSTTKLPAPVAVTHRAGIAQSTSQSGTKAASEASSLRSTPLKAHSAAFPPSPAEMTGPKLATPLLARSPTKASLFPRPNVDKPNTMATALLARSPSKPTLFKKQVDTALVQSEEAVKHNASPLLSRSPVRGFANTSGDSGAETETTPMIPFLSRSPSKLPLPGGRVDSGAPDTPGQASSHILNRFNLLRKSPMKSILRSPQRLYSDDPEKVAAGTHFATPPPKHVPHTDNKHGLATPAPVPTTVLVQKRVEFTSSTKARDVVSREQDIRTPSKSPTPPVKFGRGTALAAESDIPDYPSLPMVELSPSPQKRRQTAAPRDFTFRAGDGIIFARSPSAPVSTSHSVRPSTIRHVSSDQALPPPPPTGSKKRKFDFENETINAPEDEAATQDKENTPAVVLQEDELRPAKRTKPNTPQPSPMKAATRPPTLGVKPAKGKDVKKRPALISNARLAALAQPKRRG